jgi:hypothetical protein
MKPILQKPTVLHFTIILFFGLILTSCEKNYGTKLEFNHGELYYTKNVQEAEAKKLGEFLQKDNIYFDGRPKSVQIDKDSSGYIFRAVVLKGIEKDTSNILPFSALGLMLSAEVFNHAPVTVEMCDEKFDTLRSIPFKE